MVIRKDGSARISTGSMTYLHRISDIKDTMAEAVDKPIIFKYEVARKDSHIDSQRSAKVNASPILKMKAGATSQAIEYDL